MNRCYHLFVLLVQHHVCKIVCMEANKSINEHLFSWRADLFLVGTISVFIGIWDFISLL